MSNEIPEYYEKNGEFEKAKLQRESIKKIAAIRHKASFKKPDTQTFNKFTLLVPSHQTTLKILCIATLVFFTGVIIYNGTSSK